jgi:hypothetical protein
LVKIRICELWMSFDSVLSVLNLLTADGPPLPCGQSARRGWFSCVPGFAGSLSADGPPSSRGQSAGVELLFSPVLLIWLLCVLALADSPWPALGQSAGSVCLCAASVFLLSRGCFYPADGPAGSRGQSAPVLSCSARRRFCSC